MRHGSLFSGIGGFDLAAEWMGWENVFHCEWMEFPRKVLEYHFPNADSHIDICKTDFKKYARKIDISHRWVSLANHSQWQEKEKGQMMNATSGAKCLEQYKKLSPNSSSQKTSLVSQILTGEWYSSRCALTWKLKGTKFSRLLFHLQVKTLRTSDKEFGLLPTPCQYDYNSARTEQKWEIDKKKYADKGVNLQMGLKQMARFKMLPTPTCQDSKQKENSPSQQHKTNELSIAVAGGSNSQLNPRFVAEMMGFPPNWTEFPFLSGEQNQLKDTETP
jgi:hypothetical protein